MNDEKKNELEDKEELNNESTEDNDELDLEEFKEMLENEIQNSDLSDDEKIDIIAQRILKRYLPAFKELAK